MGFNGKYPYGEATSQFGTFLPPGPSNFVKGKISRADRGAQDARNFAGHAGVQDSFADEIVRKPKGDRQRAAKLLELHRAFSPASV